MTDILHYDEEKSASLHGIASMYADTYTPAMVPHHIIVAECLSYTHSMAVLYGQEGITFAWDTINAIASDPDQPLATVGDILSPVKEYLENSTETSLPHLDPTILCTPLLPDTPTRTIHRIPDWNTLVETRDDAVYDAHQHVDAHNTWGAITAMYTADVASFQLWASEYSTLITHAQALNVSGTPVLYNIGDIVYDIMWDFALAALKDMGDIPQNDLAEALTMWRSRLLWVAGPNNGETLLEYFNGTIQPHAV